MTISRTTTRGDGTYHLYTIPGAVRDTWESLVVHADPSTGVYQRVHRFDALTPAAQSIDEAHAAFVAAFDRAMTEEG